MIYLAFGGGIVVGCIITGLYIYNHSGLGYFKLAPYDEDDTGFYAINITIEPTENLLKKNLIVLKRDSSQK